jgi:hypothetical protein
MGSALFKWVKFRGSMRAIKVARRIKDSESVSGGNWLRKKKAIV